MSDLSFVSAFFFLSNLEWSTPKQEEEAVDLQHDTDNWPANQHDENTTEEEAGGLHLVLLEEEAERPLQTNDKGKSGHKQDLQQESQQVNLAMNGMNIIVNIDVTVRDCGKEITMHTQ